MVDRFDATVGTLSIDGRSHDRLKSGDRYNRAFELISYPAESLISVSRSSKYPFAPAIVVILALSTLPAADLW